jgi:hypothetical protein
MNLLIKLYAVSNETFVVVGFISLFLRRNLICFGVALPGFLTGLFFFRASFNFTFSSLSLCHRPSSSFVGLYRFTFDQFIFAIVVCRNVNDVQIYEKFRYDQNKKCLGYVSHSEQVGLSNIPVTYTPVTVPVYSVTSVPPVSTTTSVTPGTTVSHSYTLSNSYLTTSTDIPSSAVRIQ